MSQEELLKKAEIGIFGGSGFYSLFDKAEEVEMETPYGAPSDKITIGEIAGRRVAFLPRHGRGHKFAPHTIPYRANLWAFKNLGVERIIGPAAAGSLQAKVKPGEFVICDQFVDRTWGRPATFYDGPEVKHVSFAEPYCAEMRALAADCCEKLDIAHHKKGTVVVVQGPRFSTKAESRFYGAAGFEVINMTQCPEAILARELEMCYMNVSLITDYDVGVEGDESAAPVTAAMVGEIFKKNNERVKQLIFKMIEQMPKDRKCACGQALSGAAL